MGVVEITLAVSLDGYVTGPDPTAQDPLGVGGGDVIGPGGERWMVDESSPPFKMPVFVPTHRPREVRTAGATTFTFVADVESAIAQAKEAAGDKNVHIMGGASTADQALQLGLVDQLNLHIDPVLLGGGTQLFADVGSDRIRLERTRLIEGPRATHVQYRILRD